MTNGLGKSDSPTVPAKSPNNAGQPVAEGMEGKGPALRIFRHQVGRLWHRTLSRRSQNGRVLWDRMRRLIKHWLPLPTVCHPYPLRRMGVVT
jgi:RNA-directed DNA polymerase